jgi:hypothetical protein
LLFRIKFTKESIYSNQRGRKSETLKADYAVAKKIHVLTQKVML